MIDVKITSLRYFYLACEVKDNKFDAMTFKYRAIKRVLI